jgi:hypothetical protein
MKRPLEKSQTVGGSIRADEVLPLQEFCRRLRIGQKTWRSMKAAGLRSCEFGRQRYIVGRDALNFFTTLAERQAGDATSRIVEEVMQ